MQSLRLLLTEKPTERFLSGMDLFSSHGLNGRYFHIRFSLCLANISKSLYKSKFYSHFMHSFHEKDVHKEGHAGPTTPYPSFQITDHW